MDNIKIEEELQNHKQIETQTEANHIKPSYSQALQNNSTLPTRPYINNGDNSDTWPDKLLNNMKSNLTDFDTIVWHYDRIVKALESPEGIQEFVTYKLQTRPTPYIIPPAILLKFKYLDTQFFTSFTRNKQITPAHQKEFENMLTTATNTYKHTNNIIIIN